MLLVGLFALQRTLLIASKDGGQNQQLALQRFRSKCDQQTLRVFSHPLRYHRGMPDFEDAWMSDIVATLDVTPERSLDAMLADLKAAGLDVKDTDADEATVQGVIETAKVHVIEKLPGVQYVRSNFMWIADYPPGDPRDRDGEQRPF